MIRETVSEGALSTTQILMLMVKYQLAEEGAE
jgi:hypothetical protein